MSGLEIQLPNIADAVFKYTWIIKKYARSLDKEGGLDSPSFEVNVNGVWTQWNLSIRYWTGPHGQRLTNPVVLCLNLLKCSMDEPEQVRVKFQFGVFNEEVKQYEMCNVNRVILNMQTSDEMLSVGYRDMTILDRHLSANEEVNIFCKLQLNKTDMERHSLSQDLRRLLMAEQDTDLVLCAQEREFRVHRNILSARSPVFAAMFKHNMQESALMRVDIKDINAENLQELLRYIYTDRVDNLETLAQTLMAAAEKYQLPGLKAVCERSLVETITPESVATLLLLADQFQCDTLKKATLAYCEDNAGCIRKTLAWKVMEIVNPQLFEEACEVTLGDSVGSMNSDSPLFTI